MEMKNHSFFFSFFSFQEYIEFLKRKDEYQAIYEDWPLRKKDGSIHFMTYHYEAIQYCELCQRLWNLDEHRKTIPNIVSWFDRQNCYPPDDLL